MFWFILSQSNKYSINARYLHDFYMTKKNNVIRVSRKMQCLLLILVLVPHMMTETIHAG